MGGTVGARGGQERLIDRYDVALFDLDGVLYVGPDAVPGAGETVATLRQSGVPVAYVTNNASRTPMEVKRHLIELGIARPDDVVVTSAQVGARLVARLVGHDRGSDHRSARRTNVLAIGGPGVASALEAEELVPVSSAEEAPVAVLQGYGPDVGWRELTEAVFAVRTGIPWVATNADRTMPTPRGIGPGNGLLVGVVEAVTGVSPYVAGKPAAGLLKDAVVATRATTPLVIGDRLDTDIAAANTYGCDSLLVLSGVTSAYELVTAKPGERPTHLGVDTRALLDPPWPVVVGPTSGRRPRGGSGESPSVACAGWTARVEAGVVTLKGRGPKIAGLLAVARLAWGRAPEASPIDVDAALASLGWPR